MFSSVFNMQDGKTLDNELEVVEGMKFDRGYISPYFITDNKTMKCELENPYILIFEKKISGLNSVLPLLENVLKQQRPLVIIAEDVESEALATLEELADSSNTRPGIAAAAGGACEEGRECVVCMAELRAARYQCGHCVCCEACTLQLVCRRWKMPRRLLLRSRCPRTTRARRRALADQSSWLGCGISWHQC